jgi:23S rRNA (guanosine2251-2'-O)-methyltransferase
MIIFSKQVSLYVLEKHKDIIKKVYLSKELDKKLFSRFSRLNVEILRIDNKKAQSMARGGNHQGIFLEIDDIDISNKVSKSSKFIVVLYKVTDIGNIGSIIRSSLALGVDEVIISGTKGTSVEGIIRTSMGAFFDMKISLIENTDSLLNFLIQNGFVCYGTDSKGNDIKGLIKKDTKALFVGNEHDGLSGKILRKMDEVLSIEMQNDFDSLNVACATSILIDRLNRIS